MVELMTINKELPGGNPTIEKKFFSKKDNKSMFVGQYAPSDIFGG